jgi:predicted DNA-binding helix-hairpin-helix protein
VASVQNITSAHIQELPRIPGTETKQHHKILEEVRKIHLERTRRTDTRLKKTNTPKKN